MKSAKEGFASVKRSDRGADDGEPT